MPAGWQAPGRSDRYADPARQSQAVTRAGAQWWASVAARLQEPNTITGILIVLLIIILLFHHPLARAIGTESPPAALSGSTDTAAPPAAPVAPSSVATLGHAWSQLPAVPQHDPFEPWIGQAGTLQSPAAIGPVPQHAAPQTTGSTLTEGSAKRQGGHGGGAQQSAQSQKAGGSCAAHQIVQSGDSLWSIADANLMNRGYRSVDAAVHALYTSNRKTIGTDPSYLVPGERLCLPKA